MKIIVKIFEFSSSVFSKSQQLKDIYLKSITEGFDLNVNIFYSISNNISHTINYNGNLSTIKICLMKNKTSLGIGQMHIINQNQKQNIKIYPSNLNSNDNYQKNKINLILSCINKNDSSKKLLESYKNPNKTTYNNNFCSSNTNNTSTLSMSSLIKSPNKNNSQIINDNNKKTISKRYQRNKSSQNNIKGKTDNKKLFTGLTQNYVHSINSNIFKQVNDHAIIYSDGKRKLSGNISNSGINSNYFSEKKEKHKKIFSNIYYFPFNKNNILNDESKNRNTQIRNFKNNTKVNNLIISNIDLKINNGGQDKKYNFLSDINLDKMNKQIEEYIIDKSFEDVLQNDMPIINQEEKQFLYYDDYNSNKFNKMVKDFMLLYKEDSTKNINDNDIKLEINFLIEKIYELMKEYYREYYNFDNQNNSLMGVIKYFGYRYNNLLKKVSRLKIKFNNIKIKNDLKTKKNKYKYCNKNINKIKNEINILNYINENAFIKKENKANNNKKLKNIFTYIINKNKNELKKEEKDKLKNNMNINLIEDRNLSIQDLSNANNYSKDKTSSINSFNKRLDSIKNQKKIINNCNNRKTSVEVITRSNIFLNLKEKSNYRVIGNNIIKVKTKIKKRKQKNKCSSINQKDLSMSAKKMLHKIQM